MLQIDRFARQEVVAILVDGGFYLKRAKHLFGCKSAEDRANELVSYCCRHLKIREQPQSGKSHHDRYNHLYRIFYYDCPPLASTCFHLFLQKHINMKKTEDFVWTNKFHSELANKRKVALRFGELQERDTQFTIKHDSLKKLCSKKMSFDDLREDDFKLNYVQKGVDMRIGLDIASLAYKHQVSQIVLISGDSDFVPAAKLARREGIDFILDSMHQKIRPNLNEHIDGRSTPTPSEPMTDKTFCQNV